MNEFEKFMIINKNKSLKKEIENLEKYIINVDSYTSYLILVLEKIKKYIR